MVPERDSERAFFYPWCQDGAIYNIHSVTPPPVRNEFQTGLQSETDCPLQVSQSEIQSEIQSEKKVFGR